MRRAVAAVALLVLVILIVIGVHSCQVSQTNSALRDYSNSVAALIQSSDQTGRHFFGLLSSGQISSNSTSLRAQIEEARLTARHQLTSAQGLSAPDQVKTAQQHLVLALQLRTDGIANIAPQLAPALQPQTSADAINSIAAEMARFYASDVVYKDYTLPEVVAALHNAGIDVGGTNGVPINQGQFLPDLQWLTPSFVASQLHVSAPSSSGGKLTPGLHGHALDSVSVGGTTLQTGSTNTLPASPPPTFTLTFTNTGQNTETNVICKVSVSGTSLTGQTAVPQTQAGQQYNCQVSLPSSPPAGSYTVTATVQPVPGEKNIANNTLTFPVTFK